MGVKAPTETALVRAVLDYLQARRIFAWRNNNAGTLRTDRRTGRTFYAFHGLRGTADVLGVLPPRAATRDRPAHQGGQLLALEMKTGRGRTTPEQEAFLAAVAAQGGVSAVIRDVRDVESLLAELGY